MKGRASRGVLDQILSWLGAHLWWSDAGGGSAAHLGAQHELIVDARSGALPDDARPVSVGS